MAQYLPYLFIAIYGLTCVLHLLLCTSPEYGSARSISKCFLMPLLALCYWFGADSFSPIVFAAILLGFAGDALLIYPERKPFFIAGLVSFALGHVCYTVHMVRILPRIPAWWIIALVSICYLVAAFLLLKTLKPHLPDGLFAPCLIYIMLICIMSITAFFVMLGYGSLYGILAFIGSLFFLASDALLSLFVFGVYTSRWRNFIVMSTYILAQTLIINGLMYL